MHKGPVIIYRRGACTFFPTTFLEIAVYFVNMCEAMFSTERLKIFKCLLETNLASSVKPSNYSRILGNRKMDDNHPI